MAVKNKLVRVGGWAIAGAAVVAALVLVMGIGINVAIRPLAVALKDVGKLSARIDSLESTIKDLKQDIRHAANRPQPAQPQEPPVEDMNKVYDLPVGESYVMGNPSAKITIVEFTDFQCPFCSRFHPFIKEVYKNFPNDVKIMVKNFPLGFHPNARPAAKAALAAGLQGKYFEMTDLLFANNKDLSGAKYVELAGQLGLNVEQFTSDLKNKDAELERKIEADIALAGQSDVRGTPTYFLNGKKTNARTTEAWKAEVEALLKQ